MTDFLLPEGIQGFSPSEAYDVVENFVCALCWSSLLAIHVQGDYLMLVVCPEHGNIELCGRVTKNTVSIELERGFENYHKVIRNLADLWGHLIDAGFEYENAIKLTKHNVCAKCGGMLVMVMNPKVKDGFSHVDIHCARCRKSVSETGYVRKEKYYADFRTH